MSKVVHKNLLASRNSAVPLTVSADQVAIVLDVTNCNGASFQLNGIVGTAGSAKVQESLDGTNYQDITGATKTLAASVANIITVTNIYTGSLRLLVTLSAGAGNYDVFSLGKEH